jgi:3-oxoacyl-(acyl-carrier-protein) synthase/3-hydroxymyristoyl/3-hydroxydecanoyl-(acyl carrier protein) dehydratase/1-acyl-sn-glycerol-3-phosphate acyltransferase
MSFSPVAIVGQACVLPGALDPEQLWRLVSDQRVMLGPAPAGRWGVDPSLVLARDAKDTADKTLVDRGGYVQGFERVFDPTGFEIAAEDVAGLDPLFQWLLHVGRQALRDANFRGDRGRGGVVIGNLSYPSSSLTQFAERFWLEAQPGGAAFADRVGVGRVAARNRFMSGLPAHDLARALGLGGDAFALDAACASSLYAIKLACDALADGRADLMLAGAVNRADDLFIHQGFTALSALSPTGQSRPFHAEADGLVPGEGAAIFALRRLADAQRDGNRILGVIRGIGLSNDGRGRGLLVPSEEGQLRALRAAYAAAELDPADVSLVECHATGTTVGDAVEIGTLARLFAGRPAPVAIGSLKANLGHLITVAGSAALMKVLGAMRAGVLPATPSITRPNAALQGTPLRVLHKPEAWNTTGPRRAGISAFGFGGNNAHLIVEEFTGGNRNPRVPAPSSAPPPTVAIVSVGARVGSGTSTADFAQALFTGHLDSVAARTVDLSLKGLRFPPKDLDETLPQQLVLLAAAREAVDALPVSLPRERTSVLVGMQCDAEIARHGARWRSAGWATPLDASTDWVKAARDSFVPLLGAAGVIGAMPNIVANRLNSQFDLAGPSLSLSSEELSGVRALQIARRALIEGEIDAAVVGAVDMSAEPVHESAATAVLPASRHRGGDAAVVLVLKRLDDARRDGDKVLAVLGQQRDKAPGLWLGDGDATGLHGLFGHAHAASGLLHVAAAALCCGCRALPSTTPVDAIAVWKGRAPRAALVWIEAAGAQNASVWLEEPPGDVARWPLADRESALLPHLRASVRVPESPVLSFAAHRAQPVLPPIAAPPPEPAMSVATGLDVQRMEPAPRLPSVLDVVVVPTRAPALPTGPLGDVVARSLAQRRQVAELHSNFLGQQAALHQQFLAARARARHIMFGGALAAIEPAPLPAPITSTAPTPALITPVAPTLPAPITPAAPTVPTRVTGPRGRAFSRAELEIHAAGRISQLFGAAFAGQDDYAIQVRMPKPPLLLADRVTGIEGEPGSMGLGTVWTETDVRDDSWFLNRGFMPAGIMIESGQADLFLISYLGVDKLNQGRRAYRLLGCELTYHGSLPQPGDTLRYDIHVDSHARQGDVRLFFFHYDCMVGDRRALTVRQGQAGFFTAEELANSAGVLWSPEQQKIRDDARLDPPAVTCTRRQFSEEQVRALSEGDAFACFGPGFETAQAHVRTPAIQNGKMLLVGSVEEFDPAGGPWKRGYLKAHTPISPDDWFFQGHFKNDPCMPGTLMFEGCLQMMAIYLAGLGYTLDRDGWRFEPVPEENFRLQCRGQVLPTSKDLVCEMFVEEVHDGPFPTVYADLLGTVDGLKAFHARRVGLRLVPDWPISRGTLKGFAPPFGPDTPSPNPRSLRSASPSPPAIIRAGQSPSLPARISDMDWSEVLRDYVEPKPVASVNGFDFGYRSLINCAWGKPSQAFGPLYTEYDGPRKLARLPGPPYHFMSRVVRIEGDMGARQPGATIEVEYDVPARAWYFDENGHPVMPYCVLLEAALQPCGWLATYVGSALGTKEDLAFRNLDGTGRVLGEVNPDAGPLRTVTTLKSISRSGGMVLESFQVRCFLGDTAVYELSTGFGFFPAAAFENQAGLAVTPEARALLDAPSDFQVDLRTRPDRYFAGPLSLPGPMLLMLDRITAWSPNGGRAGLGWLRAEKDVNPAEWFFKAHFFQDPVQPGSLGLEAMIQLLQFHMLHAGLGEGLQRPRFVPIENGRAHTWKYRGQVVPKNRLISVTMEIVEQGRDADGAFAVADTSLWVDGKRIYEMTGLGMRIVEGRAPDHPSSAPVRTLSANELIPIAREAWRGFLGAACPPVEDVCRGLILRFLRQVHIQDEAALSAARQGGVILLGNHQVMVESTVFAIVASALLGTPVLTLARAENQTQWLDRFMVHTFAYPGLQRPRMSQYFDRDDRGSLPALIAEMSTEMRATGRSIMVHVEGAMAKTCRTPVQKISSTFIDMALELNRPIVPVRFVGGLPAAPVADEIDFPVGMGQQDIYLGAPLSPDELRALNYRERRERVLDAINGLGPAHTIEEPLPGNPEIEAAAADWADRTGASYGHATLFRILEQLPHLSSELASVVQATATLHVPATPAGQWLAELARRLYGPRGPKIARS